MSKTVTIFSTVVDGPEGCSPGPAGDGTFVVRFRAEKDMKAYVKDKTYYGRPAQYHKEEVSRRLAQRWGLA